jgi:hypothetical protein
MPLGSTKPTSGHALIFNGDGTDPSRSVLEHLTWAAVTSSAPHIRDALLAGLYARALSACRRPQSFLAWFGVPTKHDAGMKLSVVVLCRRGKFGWSPSVVTTAIEV